MTKIFAPNRSQLKILFCRKNSNTKQKVWQEPSKYSEF